MIDPERILFRLQQVIDDCRQEIKAEKPKYGVHVSQVSASIHVLNSEGNFYYTTGQFGSIKPRKTIAVFNKLNLIGDTAEILANRVCKQLNQGG